MIWVRAWSGLRGVMLMAFSVALVLAPEKVMPGSSAEPARSLALVFASRNVLFGATFVGLAARNLRRALGWLLIADFAFQIFDTGLALAMHKGAIAAMPASLGVLQLVCGLYALKKQ